MTRPRIPARPTLYKGIQMRSRLEARFAEILDTIKAPWKYEGKAYASEKGQYLPDFVIGVEPWCDTFIEVKPYLDVDDNNPDELLDKMHVILDSRVGLDTTLAIASPCLGNLMYCEHNPAPGTPFGRERGIGCWTRNYPGPGDADEGYEVSFQLLFGIYSDDCVYALADGDAPLHMDWGWR